MGMNWCLRTFLPLVVVPEALRRSRHDYATMPTFNFLDTVACPELKGFFDHAKIMETKPAEKMLIR
jgi:hypothetical protein